MRVVVDSLGAQKAVSGTDAEGVVMGKAIVVAFNVGRVEFGSISVSGCFYVISIEQFDGALKAGTGAVSL